MVMKSSQIIKKATGLAIASALVATTILPVTSANADHRRHKKRHGHKVVVIEKHHHHKHYKKRRKKKHHREKAAIAAGVIGFALGAMIVDQANRNRNARTVYVQPRQPRRVYVEPRHYHKHRHNKPHVITYEQSMRATYEPWTPEWRQWCRSKYRTFNGRTGTYRGYDGLDHFCVVR